MNDLEEYLDECIRYYVNFYWVKIKLKTSIDKEALKKIVKNIREKYGINEKVALKLFCDRLKQYEGKAIYDLPANEKTFTTRILKVKIDDEYNIELSLREF